MEFGLSFQSLLIFLGLMLSFVDSIPTVRELRLTLADVASSYSNYEPEGPGTYAFGYDIDDPKTENFQFRDEERKPDGSVIGKYGWVAADGRVFVVNYVADAGGYRANIENIPNYKLRGQNLLGRNKKRYV